MPQLPMPPTDEQAYTKNTKEQYESLGRFVEAFEAMAHEARQNSIDILAKDEEHEKLVEVALHHPALTAKPLFEILRTLIADQLKQSTTKISTKDTFLGVMSQIASEYFDLVNIRNTLLHGTWYVGYVDTNDPNSEKFVVNKYKPTKTGLTKEDSPKDAAELLKLKERCEKTANWISILVSCLPADPRDETRISNLFKFKDGKWRLYYRDLPPETLP